MRRREPFGGRWRHGKSQAPEARGADQYEERGVGLAAGREILQTLLDQLSARQPRRVHGRSIAERGRRVSEARVCCWAVCVAQQLVDRGWTDACALDGGFEAWKRAQRCLLRSGVQRTGAIVVAA